MIGEEIDRPLGHKGCDRRVENRLQQADPASNGGFESDDERPPEDRGRIDAQLLALGNALSETLEGFLQPLDEAHLFFHHLVPDRFFGKDDVGLTQSAV